MKPYVVTITGDITAYVYEIAPGIWLKFTKGPTHRQYAWYVGVTWDAGLLQRQGNAPAILTYHTNGTYSFQWYHGGQLHRGDDKPAIVTIAGDNITLQWYKNGKRSTGSDFRCEYYDPYGGVVTKETCAAFAEKDCFDLPPITIQDIITQLTAITPLNTKLLGQLKKVAKRIDPSRGFVPAYDDFIMAVVKTRSPDAAVVELLRYIKIFDELARYENVAIR